MKIVKVLSVVSLVLMCSAAVGAEEAVVHLFLNEKTAQTKIDGLNVRLRAELSDTQQTEREFMRTPRIWLTCHDGGRQILSVDTADDLDPWPSIVGDREIEVAAKIRSQSELFPELATSLNASRVSDLLSINVDINGRAEDIARSWLEGFPIKVTASPGGELKDLNLVIFPEAINSAFRAEAATLVRGCELLAGR
ncbi:hypothetical protein LJR221_003660 [Agrobacterium tumefaciens]